MAISMYIFSFSQNLYCTELVLELDIIRVPIYVHNNGLVGHKDIRNT